MADQWFFAWDGQQFGPFSAVRLRELATLGRLQPQDTVWKDGTEKRVMASRVRHLFGAPPAEALAAQADVLAVQEPPSSPQAPDREAGPAPIGAAEGEVLPPPATDQAIPEEQRIPDGLALLAVPGQAEWAPRVSPPPASAPGSTPGADQGPATTPAKDRAPGGPAAASPHQPGPPKKLARKWHATGVKGAVIVGQDNDSVRYRKKCGRCGHEDACTNSMPVRNGVTSGTFFCPKCKKTGQVVIQGMT